MTEGVKGCGGCHKIGLKSEQEIKDLKKTSGGFGVASCDACHTRHTFSKKEAQQPQACQTCRMGFDHPQWEMYSASKHGVRALLRQNGTLPPQTPAPTCQDCHMQGGHHAVDTAWGFLAVRLPLPEDKQWAADRVTILQALGVLDPAANRPRGSRWSKLPRSPSSRRKTGRSNATRCSPPATNATPATSPRNSSRKATT